ncbi:30S ribosomal protein S17 [Mycoplasma marinum]|uniref:Small ribosomal subunit protein uS17 n=1 Tax=Mycoplasma marinum TaxID=1937190 RepID=A0A4R0XU00_9MOLU|nr:30S ribosomal protein S17 [Mycoplasma marinum]TCG11139.1 30S ribosomal protein S17 [Mycoplasma marinum]
MERQTSRKSLNGYVVSNKNEKTVVVAVDTYKKHPLYSKRFKSTKRYQVHVDGVEANLGDFVRIDECRPVSKTKRFRLVEILEAKKEGK